MQIRLPDDDMVQAICDNSDVVAKLTLAPELNDDENIRKLVESGVRLSAGHTNATFKEAKHGFEQGITMATHLFNAMPPI